MDRRFKKRIERYLAQCAQTSLLALAKLNPDGWFCYWHTHPDLWRKANRASELVALSTYRLLQEAERLIATPTRPIQAWAIVCPDTGDDAVFLHSENPQGVPYPHTFDGVEWDTSSPGELSHMIEPSHEVGRLAQEDGFVYVIRRRG